MWFQSWLFSMITPVFSVTRCFRNHSNTLIWCSRTISYYSFSRLLKQFSWNCASFLRIHNFFLYSGQNEAFHSKQLDLAEKPNFALRHDTQTLKHTHTLQHGFTVVHGTPQVFYSLISCTVEYSTKPQTTTKVIIQPQHPVFGLWQAKEPLQHHRILALARQRG